MSNNIDKSRLKKTGLGRGLGTLLDAGTDSTSSSTGSERYFSNQASVPLSSLKGSPELPKEAPEKTDTAVAISEETRVWTIPVEKIKPNAKQPRTTFEEEKLLELSASIRENGIIQPIIVRRISEGFEIIAGERRWRAAQKAGLHEVPAIVRRATDRNVLEIALIENIQRADLSPLEESRAYLSLSEDFQLSHNDIALKVGKDRATVSNAIRLLSLHPEVQTMLSQQRLSVGHAKVLLGLIDTKKQLELARKTIEKKLSVRALEGLISTDREAPPKASSESSFDFNVSEKLVKSLSEELQKALGTKVLIEYHEGRGKVVIRFFSDDQLSQLAERIRG